MDKPYYVHAVWDEEAQVWVASSEDVPGLATESETAEALVQKRRDWVKMTEWPGCSSRKLFAGRHFDAEILVLCVRWYLSFKLSYRDLVTMLSERGHSSSPYDDCEGERQEAGGLARNAL